MFSLNKLFPVFALVAISFLPVAALAADTGHYGIGTTATAKEIAGWDIDVRPDGKGLPKGEGSVAQGEPMYEAKCASCHGSFGEGEDRWPPLAGGEGSLTEDRPEKTVGSYWPYASTLWDYINRAMPFTAPQSLTPHEVYAISAYVLYLNDLVEDDFVLTQSNLASVKMPNVDNFYIDNRPDTNNKRCMKDCKDPSKIVIIKSLSGITPDQNEDSAEAAAEKPKLSESAIAGKATYTTSCLVCHGSGVAGAPTLDDKESWNKRLEQGVDTVVKHAIKGFMGESGMMPPKGGNLSLSDQQVKDAVQYMLEAQ
ncbi:MAG TPA: c-type cytochrome [Cycloclasticus sp.]|jgi:cytochrome c|nr:c-type cytochrome [Cycloclasticus sp.]HIL92662.1 c-type cytochrome [Cycloclasticus sp.]